MEDNRGLRPRGSGDFVAQRIEGTQGFNLRRLLSTALYGGLFLAPAGHVWYRLLDKSLAPRFAPSTLPFVVSKVALDNLLFTPVHVVLFFSWFNFIAEQQTLEVLALKLRTEYVSTVLVELVVWPGWQILTFRVVPLHHQLMTSNLLTLGEATALPLINAKGE